MPTDNAQYQDLIAGFIVVPQAAHWQRPQRLLQDASRPPFTRRVYNLYLDEFLEWLQA